MPFLYCDSFWKYHCITVPCFSPYTFHLEQPAHVECNKNAFTNSFIPFIKHQGLVVQNNPCEPKA